MNQSRACRLGESILALLLFFTLAFAPLCQARAQEPSAGSLASAQVQSAGLTESSGEVVEQSNASSKVSYQGARLAKSDSPYACIFAVLRAQSRVIPRVQTEAPVRDMDEAMEAFGAGPDGVEPLLRPFSGGGAQPVHFHPRSAATH